MVRVENIKVYDLEESIAACRYAFQVNPDREFNEKSLARAIALAKSPTNSGHGNFLTGIRVSFDIWYPQYFTPQLQRYHFLDIVCSASKDHRLNRIIEAKCFNKYVTPETLANLQKYVDAYNADNSYENYMTLISNAPLGLELFMRCSTNYMQLKNIYRQRKNKDKLKEDWDGFCNMIEKLPYFEEFINTPK